MVRLKTAVEEVKNKAGPPSEKLNMVRLRTAVEEVESKAGPPLEKLSYHAQVKNSC
jgi:hypothetical protein